MHAKAPKKPSTRALDQKLSVASAEHDWPEARSLIEQGANIDHPTRGTPLHHACADQNLAMVRWLLARNAELEVRRKPGGWTPLAEACNKDGIDIVRVLIDKGADVNTEDDEGQSLLGKTSNPDIISLLLKNGATPKPSALLAACDTWSKFMAYDRPAEGKPYERCVELLLAAGIDANAVINDTTPLIMAVNKYPELTKLLLKHGADPKWARKDGSTALSIATARGYAKTASALTAGGAKAKKRA